MSPTLVRRNDGAVLAYGSGGSNQIHSTILQMLLSYLSLSLDLEEAVAAPRIHLEQGLLQIEHGHGTETEQQLASIFPRHQIWPDRNFFFFAVYMLPPLTPTAAPSSPPVIHGAAAVLPKIKKRCSYGRR